jgi:hypothetical protein
LVLERHLVAPKGFKVRFLNLAQLQPWAVAVVLQAIILLLNSKTVVLAVVEKLAVLVDLELLVKGSTVAMEVATD